MMQARTQPAPHTLGTMTLGEVEYTRPSSLVVDGHGDCYLSIGAPVQPTQDATHPVCIIRAKRGYLVDVTNLVRDVAVVGAVDGARYAPVALLTYGGEVLHAA